MKLKDFNALLFDFATLKSKYNRKKMELVLQDFPADDMEVISEAYGRNIQDAGAQQSISIKSNGIEITVWGWKNEQNKKVA